MKIIYISSTNSGMHSQSIYFDLLTELRDQGHEITIVYGREARLNKDTELYTHENMQYLGVKTGNITKNKDLIEKAVSTLRIDSQFKSAIEKNLKDQYYDLVLFSTPPITFLKTIKYFKNSGAFIYLMLKDIFPQNAVDIGMFSSKGPINWFFRRKEIKTYAMSDFIGVMSNENLKYITHHNPEVSGKVEVFPNAIKMVENGKANKSKTDFNVEENELLLLYGGNLGKPQGVDFILECMSELENISKVKLIICGSGSESSKIENMIKEKNLKNTKYLGQLPIEEYNDLTKLADVGLIYLDRRFTIPNYPQRTLSYMNASIPILFATDANTDVGKDAVANNYGLLSNSGDVESWTNNVLYLRDNPSEREKMGRNGNLYLQNHFNVETVVNTLLAHFKDQGFISRKKILSYDIVNGDYSSLMQEFNKVIDDGNKARVFAINPEKIMIAREDKNIDNLLRQAEYLIPDGIGVVKVAKSKNTPLRQRITGFDTFISVMEYASKNNKGVFLYGGKPDVVEVAVRILKERYGEQVIKGYIDGYSSEEAAVKQINDSDSQFLFVAQGSPKQEIFMSNNFNNLNVNIMQGVGGSFDVVSGRVKRAPVWAQKMNLEWFYRLVTDPKRIFRQMKLLKFVWYAYRDGK